MMISTPNSAQAAASHGRSTRQASRQISAMPSPASSVPPRKRRRISSPAHSPIVMSGISTPDGLSRQTQESGTYKSTGTRSRPGLSARTQDQSRQAAASSHVSPEPRRQSRRSRQPVRPRFSSAAAAAAAAVNDDGYKPREERGWEEFHPQLDIAAKLPVFDADQVDGIQRKDGDGESPNEPKFPQTKNGVNIGTSSQMPETGRASSPREHSSRPPRKCNSMLKGIGRSPNQPKSIPPPGYDPRERLTLPKPTYHAVDPFAQYEDKEEFVGQAMANVGYQESEIWTRPNTLIRVTEGNIEDDLASNFRSIYQGSEDDAAGIGPHAVGRVEYDMDEQDTAWLAAYNEERKRENLPEIKTWLFEIMMTKIEKEWHTLEKRIPKPNPKPPQTHRPRSSSAAAVNGEPGASGEEPDSKCVICDDGDCENTNAIVFCDGCDLAVHQECYGVPFIPEGQWLCRKCQLIGRGTPTCIFCPNTDGAFKQTNASRWAHLLCAIWIPEISLGNTTFMEPVMDVEKVPKGRWKLNCYICRQKMGACIQCANKNCYVAFHVTCARRAKLYLRTKSAQDGIGPVNAEPGTLKAYCDKHVPDDWRSEHDVDHAIIDTMDYYRYAMQGKVWADSQQLALAAGEPYAADGIQPSNPANNDEVPASESLPPPKITLKLGTKSTAKSSQPPKMIWKLPSGAPVIPQVLYNSIELSLSKYSIQKRKLCAADMCKFWTLKREARRGAALLKRLQMQMEPFTSMEIPRRNFTGMGAVGGIRLRRRIQFAERLLEDVAHLQHLCDLVAERERQKLVDARMLENLVDTIYFPLQPLFAAIVARVVASDGRRLVINSLGVFPAKFRARQYTTVMHFSRELLDSLKACTRLFEQETVDKNQTFPTVSIANSKEQRDKLILGVIKRIAKNIQPLTEDALRKENSLLQNDDTLNVTALNEMFLSVGALTLKNPISDDHVHISHDHAADTVAEKVLHSEVTYTGDQERIDKADAPCKHRLGKTSESNMKDSDQTPNGIKSSEHSQILGKSKADHKDHPSLLPNGTFVTPEPEFPSCPWYIESFNPDGTTLHEEQWTSNDLLREPSEDLSDIDDLEMSTLLPLEPDPPMGSATQQPDSNQIVDPDIPSQDSHHVKSKKRKKKAQRYR